MSTKLNWQAMTARERDALVGEHLFGLMDVDVVQRPPGTEGYRCDLSGWWIVQRKHDGALLGMNHMTKEEALFQYCRDEHWFHKWTTCPKAAMEVIEAMRAKGFYVRLDTIFIAGKPQWECFIYEPTHMLHGQIDCPGHCWAADTMPEAVSRAALLAVGVEVG